MRRALNLPVVIVFLGLLAGCDLFASSEQEDKSPPELRKAMPTTIEPGLEVRLLAPDTVEVAAPFEVGISVRNRANKDLILQVNGCIFEPDFFFGNRDRVLFKGSNVGCLAGSARHLIQEGEALKETFQLQAVRRLPSGEEKPVSPGHYIGRAEFGWWVGEPGRLAEARKVMLSALEWGFVVRP